MWCICNRDWFGDCYSERFFWLKEFALLFCYMLFVMAMMMAMIRTKGMCDGIDDPESGGLSLSSGCWSGWSRGRWKGKNEMSRVNDIHDGRRNYKNRLPEQNLPPLCGRYSSEKLNSNSSINHGDGTRKQSCFLPLDFFLETLEKT